MVIYIYFPSCTNPSNSAVSDTLKYNAQFLNKNKRKKKKWLKYLIGDLEFMKRYHLWCNIINNKIYNTAIPSPGDDIYCHLVQ